LDGWPPEARFTFFLTFLFLATVFFPILLSNFKWNNDSTLTPRTRDKRAASSSEGFALFASIAFNFAGFTPDASANPPSESLRFKRFARTKFELLTSLANFKLPHLLARTPPTLLTLLQEWLFIFNPLFS
jgi:hypothetical protein